MDAVLKKIENSEAYFEFTIAYSKFEQAIQQVYKKTRKKYQVPGFRKGAAPRSLIEARYGPEVFYQDALELIMPDEYQAAVAELQLQTIGDPDIEVGYIEKGKDLHVKVCVPVYPEIKLGKLEGLEIALPPKEEVTETMVERYLQALREQNKKITDKGDQPAEKGDTLTVDYDCTVEDTYYDPVKDYKFVLDPEGDFLLGFEESLVGAKKGETYTIEKAFPADHSLVNFAGKTARFNVTVKNVEKIELPELDDQFAQVVAQVNDLQELRAKARKDLEEMTAERALALRNQALMQALLERCEITVPESQVMQRAMGMLEQISNEMYAQGGTVDLYLQLMNKPKDEFKKQIWEDAKTQVKSEYVLDKIIKEMNVTVSEEELEAGAKRFARSVGMDPENARENLGPLMNKVEFDLKAQKVFDYLFEHAVIKY